MVHLNKASLDKLFTSCNIPLHDCLYDRTDKSQIDEIVFNGTEASSQFMCILIDLTVPAVAHAYRGSGYLITCG